jgi:hypothetical protein
MYTDGCLVKNRGLLMNLKNVVLSSLSLRPKLFGIDDLIVAGVITLIGTAVSAGVSSNSADKQVKATKEANAENMGLNLKSLAIEKQNADTSRFTAQQDAQQKALSVFNSKMKGTDLSSHIYDIWAGKA